jgi:hypothetical protein
VRAIDGKGVELVEYLACELASFDVLALLVNQVAGRGPGRGGVVDVSFRERLFEAPFHSLDRRRRVGFLNFPGIVKFLDAGALRYRDERAGKGGDQQEMTHDVRTTEQCRNFDDQSVK